MEIKELSTNLSDDFFFRFCPDPESMYDLGKLYEEFNLTFFNKELPRLIKGTKKVKGKKVEFYDRLKWDGRLKSRIQGTYCTAEKPGFGVIRLSRKIAPHPTILKGTLLHEMVHAYTDFKGWDSGLKGHGISFIQEANRINKVCETKRVQYRVNFMGKEVRKEEPIVYSKTVESNVSCRRDLDFAMVVKKLSDTVYYGNNTLSY